MAYVEYRDPRNRLHRVDGPAIESDERIEWWVDSRRHCDHGPAVVTANGTVLYYWRGVMVPRAVIMEPRSKKPNEIILIENIEVRRAWMEAYGMDDFMKNMKHKVIHEDKKSDRLLVKLDLPKSGDRDNSMEDDFMLLVRVKNSTAEGKWREGSDCSRCDKTGYIVHEESTPEEEVKRTCPDCGGKGRTDMVFEPELKEGKPYFKFYWIRVPPTMKDANEAVAWTFEESKDSYKPAVES